MAFNHCILARDLGHFPKGGLNASDDLGNSVRLLSQGRIFRLLTRPISRFMNVIGIYRNEGDVRQLAIRRGVRLRRFKEAGAIKVVIGENVSLESALRFVVRVSGCFTGERIVMCFCTIA